MFTVIRKKVRCLNCNKADTDGAEIAVKDRENCGVIFALCDDCASRLFEAVDGVTRARAGKEVR